MNTREHSSHRAPDVAKKILLRYAPHLRVWTGCSEFMLCLVFRSIARLTTSLVLQTAKDRAVTQAGYLNQPVLIWHLHPATTCAKDIWFDIRPIHPGAPDTAGRRVDKVGVGRRPRWLIVCVDDPMSYASRQKQAKELGRTGIGRAPTGCGAGVSTRRGGAKCSSRQTRPTRSLRGRRKFCRRERPEIWVRDVACMAVGPRWCWLRPPVTQRDRCIESGRRSRLFPARLAGMLG
ncbi:hypothetical protein OBBRIDRAFT_513202 [Obba rivulosa]|uniref:Uncharacterized protein n=1 Tax=Obba rivulosa TaxID=1052685 RepID=A0A8E2DMY0_9APHY|nr:hypothetical protein OBBRIDRAFT_513202 [Obba rivulosa]